MAERLRYHLVGIAGVGMSALAQVLLAEGHDVSGSDRCSDSGVDSPVLRKLGAAGVRLFPQDGSGVDCADCTVVVSSAIENDNADLRAAGTVNAAVELRAKTLARLAGSKRTVAVAGTCGKTTVTGMLGRALESLGADPTVVNGGVVLDWADDCRVGNVRVGASDLWVVETDESDRSLLLFDPDWAVITNMSKDHFDVAETEALFASFLGRVRRGAVGGPGAGPLPVSGVRHFARCSEFIFRGVTFRIRVPGPHNVANAAMAAAMCERLGFELDAVSRAMESFRGIERRLEVVGTARGITVVDDYAHNPAKLRAAWESLAPYSRRIVAAWRPHGFGPLAFMRQELADVIAGLCRPDDRFLILPVYYAGGTARRTVTSEMFTADLLARGVPVSMVPDYETCAARMTEQAEEGDVLLVMGARDPGLPLLARQVLRILQS